MTRVPRHDSIGLCLAAVAGILLAPYAPQLAATGMADIADTPVTLMLLVWAMVFPVLRHRVQSDYMDRQGPGPGPLVFLIAPVVTMSVLAWACLVAPGIAPLPAVDSYVAGLVLLAAGPGSAIATVWRRSDRRAAWLTLAPAPVHAGLLSRLLTPRLAVPGVLLVAPWWPAIALSVGLYLGVPMVLATLLSRHLPHNAGTRAQSGETLAPSWSQAALLGIVMMSAMAQGTTLRQHAWLALLVAVPILVQVGLQIGCAYHRLQGTGQPCGSTTRPGARGLGTSDGIKLAVAVAIALYGITSGAVLSLVFGALLEPVALLMAGYVMNRSHDTAWRA